MDYAQVYQDRARKWRWRLRAGNHRTILQGEAHTRPSDAVRAIRRAIAPAIVDVFKATTPYPQKAADFTLL
jgi:uncharacterized protein YegP (UPF0339 family)